MKVPLKKAINSLSWYNCQTECWPVTFKDNEIINYQIKVLSFERINLTEVDGSDKISLNLENGILWILRVEVVNLWKKTISSFPIYDSVILIDKDGSEYKPITDDHLTNESHSNYAMSSGLNLLNGSSGYRCGELIPKVPLKGALAFLLPMTENDRFYLSVEGGKIWERKETEEKNSLQGWIYALTNPSLPQNFLKIGMTTRTLEERLKELSSNTGVPTPFRVVFEAEVSDCKQVEMIIHHNLAKYRHSSSKEFFDLPQNEAIPILARICSQFPIKPSPSPEEIAKEKRVNEIEAEIERLKEELEILKG
ncbi:MAG: GIY-YIG nuclease family protein [Thermodesulfobacteriota bacterium]